jgi:hypothetical protein
MFDMLSWYSSAGGSTICCSLFHIRPALSLFFRAVSSLSGRDGSFNTMGVFPGSGNARADYESTWAKRREFLVNPGKAEPDFMADDECSRLHLGCSAAKWIAAR